MPLSNKFKTLIEDMKKTSSFYPISEDKDTRLKRKEERKEEKRSKKFEDPSVSSNEYETSSSGSGKFKLNPFIKAVEALKNNVISKLMECDVRIDSKTLGGKSTSEKYRKIFGGYLERAASLMGEALYQKDKEGKNLESGEDSTLIAGLRDSYNSLLKDIENSSKSFKEDQDKEIIEYQKGLKLKEVTTPLNDAIKDFEDASYLLSNYSKQKMDIAGGTGSASSTTTKESEIKIESPIKKWAKGKPANEEVKKVQQLIYDKFNKNPDVGTTDLFKSFSKKPFPDGYNGNNTSNLIILLKKSFKMTDATSDITQDFVNELNDIKESKNLIEEKLLSFDAFMLNFNEGFDPEIFKKAYKDYSETAAKTKPKEETKTYPSTGLSQEDGDKFRSWVSDKHADWAKENNLGKAGNPDNSYIRKAWDKFKDEFDKNSKDQKSGKDEERRWKMSGEEDKKNKEKEKTGKITNEKIEKIALGILIAMSGETEDEDAVYDEFKKIKSKEEFDMLSELWGKMNMSAMALENGAWSGKSAADIIKKREKASGGLSLSRMFNKLFSTSEIARLNTYLPDGVTKF